MEEGRVHLIRQLLAGSTSLWRHVGERNERNDCWDLASAKPIMMLGGRSSFSYPVSAPGSCERSVRENN
jgi:hypothetical protein